MCSGFFNVNGKLLRPAVTTAFLAGALSGCGSGGDPDRLPVFPAKGHITFQGEPVPGAFVVLHPKHAPEGTETVRPRAQVNPDGSFELTSYETGDGAPAGEYAVTVQWHKLVKHGSDVAPGPNVLPKKYAGPQTSPLTVRIAEDQNDLAPIVVR